ncbi:transcription factor HES-5-like [Megalops cyprinoides]|uniref:transcription factor HES-5-like n=1 Tax=Megalops cyprinoides TaxID=118141 RepID=UPI0018653298|nr:transcription factor HES-5-like [Megalops cyprinoides]
MAPHFHSSEYSNLYLSTREKNKLRKTAVEKMRRDRINSSIEQLRKMLRSELRQRDPSGRVEKADVLELAASFLKRSATAAGARGEGRDAHGEGRSQCWSDALHFLSACPKGHAAVQQLLHFHSSQRDTPGSPPEQSLVPGKQDNSAQPTLWRPW